MSDANWKELVKRYAVGRKICNCGHAYEAPCGRGIDAQGNWRTDMMTCPHGCGAAQIIAKEDIARRILAELSDKP